MLIHRLLAHSEITTYRNFILSITWLIFQMNDIPVFSIVINNKSYITFYIIISLSITEYVLQGNYFKAFFLEYIFLIMIW